MTPEKTTAIVIRVVEFSESSCVVTLMTRDLGKITALAKGARRPKSPFEAAIDVLSICRIVSLHKTNGAMDLLTEAKLERRFRSGASDLDRLYAGYYIAELLRMMTDDADPHPDVFDLARATIESIDDGGAIAENIVRFEWGLLSALGHEPMLSRCCSCGREKTKIEKVQFALGDGGVICQRCRAGKANVVSVSRDAFALLVSIAGVKLPGADRITVGGRSEHDATDGNRSGESEILATDLAKEPGFVEVRRLMQKTITHQVGREPRLLKFLKI